MLPSRLLIWKSTTALLNFSCLSFSTLTDMSLGSPSRQILQQHHYLNRICYWLHPKGHCLIVPLIKYTGTVSPSYTAEKALCTVGFSSFAAFLSEGPEGSGLSCLSSDRLFRKAIPSLLPCNNLWCHDLQLSRPHTLPRLHDPPWCPSCPAPFRLTTTASNNSANFSRSFPSPPRIGLKASSSFNRSVQALHVPPYFFSNCFLAASYAAAECPRFSTILRASPWRQSLRCSKLYSAEAFDWSTHE